VILGKYNLQNYGTSCIDPNRENVLVVMPHHVLMVILFVFSQVDWIHWWV
jgi:hypothetical protein